MANNLADLKDVVEGVFDYIVIGGGTAGCVVASRLSEDPNVSVVVLEAGPSHLNDPHIDNPSVFLKALLDSEYDYQYTTVPQPEMDRPPTMFPRGRGLGGTSQINWMIWNVPQREEVEAIGKLGNEGWTWENFAKYQKKVQRFYAPSKDHLADFRSLYHLESVGHEGPVPLIFSRDSSGAEGLWQQSLAKHGVNATDTSLDGNVVGTYKNISNIDPNTGKRAYSATTYLLPALYRPNLKVLTGAYVHKILTEAQAERVTAFDVEFEHSGSIYTVHCKTEVVVCAGTVKSPHILELSGIGDRNILEPLGINVKIDLPGVGANVQEHISMGFNRWKIKEDQNIVTSGMLEDPAQAEKLRMALGLSDAIQMVVNSVSFIPIQVGSDRADNLVQKQKEKVARISSTLSPGLKAQYELQLQMLEDPNVPDYEILFFPFMMDIFPNPEPKKPYLNMLPTLGHPFSRGTIHAGSADPKASPVIDPHYYEEEIDLDIMVDGVKFIREVSKTEPFSRTIEREELPGPEVQTDAQIYDYVRKNTTSSWHTCGSNSMLPREKGGVVDSKFRVYGTRNIRVVDLSVLPLHTAVHPQATVYTLAEMACDIIRGRFL